MKIEYDHSKNRHTLRGPQAFLPYLFAMNKPSSLIDVGCGTGLWTKAAMDLGVKDALGLDGVPVHPDQLVIPRERFLVQDFTEDWDLKRHFDMALCLEVAEHLDQQHAARLV